MATVINNGCNYNIKKVIRNGNDYNIEYQVPSGCKLVPSSCCVVPEGSQVMSEVDQGILNANPSFYRTHGDYTGISGPFHGYDPTSGYHRGIVGSGCTGSYRNYDVFLYHPDKGFYKGTNYCHSDSSYGDVYNGVVYRDGTKIRVVSSVKYCRRDPYWYYSIGYIDTDNHCWVNDNQMYQCGTVNIENICNTADAGYGYKFCTYSNYDSCDGLSYMDIKKTG